MRLKYFILGGLIGFGFGVYHGYNYAIEQCNKEQLKKTIKHEQKIDYDFNNNCLDNLLKDKSMFVDYRRAVDNSFGQTLLRAGST